MADGIKVRFANLTDLYGCIALDDPNLSAEIIGRKIAQHEIIVAEEVKRLVGYLRLEYLWSTVPYIALIRVVEDQRRQGIGKAMAYRVQISPQLANSNASARRWPISIRSTSVTRPMR